MPTRFAMRLTPELLGVVGELTGASTDVFGDNVFVVLEPLSETEFNLKLMTEETMFEAFKNDSSLHIVM